MNLTAILTEMEKNRAAAELTLDMGNPQTYNGRLGMKRAAQEAMKRLTLDYRNQLLNDAVFIIVAGPGKDAFTELASKDPFNCFTSDPEALYSEIVGRIAPSLFGRESTAALFGIASNVLYEKAMELDLGSYENISFSDKYSRGVKTPAELAELIKAAVNDQTGAEIVGINAVHDIAPYAIGINHSETIAPVVLSTNDENFALTLFKNLPELVRHGALNDAEYRAKKSKKAFLVVAGKASKALQAVPGAILVKTLTEENVGEALDVIRNKVNS